MAKSNDIAPNIICYGIRHHGPGSSHNLVKALNIQNPDVILIEGPADADDLLNTLQLSDFTPPIAILMYDAKNIKSASFFPFADFSPEWQAIKWALSQEKEMHFIDLPQGIQSMQLGEFAKSVDSDNPIIRDPMGTLAAAQGYKDVESWWEAHFETLDSTSVFSQINMVIRLMRENQTENGSREAFNDLREAHMREQIRSAVRNGHQNIAVVCGAWHAPALEDIDVIASAHDKALLKGLQKVKMSALWIPWSYKRLAKQLGYGAGMSAPMWYEILFLHPGDATHHWMAYIAHELRKMGYETPPSLSIEASRLSDHLAMLRDMQKAGFSELTEAAISVFGYTNEEIIEEIQGSILIGDRVGKVPPDAAKLPIQQDFEQCVKSYRLSKEIERSVPVEKQLDLRKEQHREASAFFHRLSLINIPWAQKHSNAGLGTFRENWTLLWDVEYHFRIIDAGVYGLTIEEAVVNKVKEDLSKNSLPELIALLEVCLDADLKSLVSDLTHQIGSKANTCQDSFLLVKTFNSLSKLIISGHAREYDEVFLQSLRSDILIYVSVRLFDEVNQLTPEKSMEVYRDLLLADQNVQQKPINGLVERWNEEIYKIGQHIKFVNAAHGACFRLGLDRNSWGPEKSATILHAVFSDLQELEASAIWMHGFFQDSFLILLYEDQLWSTLSGWINGMTEDEFLNVLPLLRRAFSSCEDALKIKLFKRVGGADEVPQVERSELPEQVRKKLDAWFID